MSSKKKVSWIATQEAITVNYAGETHIVKRSDALAEKVLLAIKEHRLEDIPDLVDAAKRIEKFSDGNFHVKNGRVQIKGQDAPQYLSNKIVQFAGEGLPFEPLMRFAENLQANPSYRACQELYSFLEQNDRPITEDGNFLAFKRVRYDFKDIHSGTFDNSPGQIVEMPRNQVDEDSSRTCSNGLHLANWEYSHTQYGNQNNDSTDVMIEVEVNPADVVAIPADYSNSKMRVSKYRVLGVIQTPFEPNEYLRNTKANEPDQEEDSDICEHCSLEKQYCECEFCDMCDAYRSIQDDYCATCGASCDKEIDDTYYDSDECEYCGEITCLGDCEPIDSNKAT